MHELSSVGKSVPRLDAIEKVTGRALFCGDLTLPRMLHAKVLRSSVPHARILGVDTSRAERLRGVKCVVTGKDAPDTRYGMVIKDQDILAKEVVRFVGEPVAAVAAASVDVAEEAIELIKVEYEPLPAVFDSEIAMSCDSQVVLHPDFRNYARVEWFPGDPRFNTGLPNVFFHFKIRKGDVDKGFQDADLVLENRFSTAKASQAALEPHSMIARSEADGGLTILSGRQVIWRLRDEASLVFGIEPAKIRISSPYIGGGFGGKVSIGEELLAALLALKTGLPVKLVYTREEVFLHGGSRVPMTIYIKDGATRDGTLVARQMTCILASGAYEHDVGIIARNCAFGAAGTYKVSNFKWDSYGVYTNEPPSSAFRGFGSGEVVWAIESHMDMLAEKLGIDPVEFRRRNILREGEPNVTGEITHSIGVRECLDKIAEIFGAKQKPEVEGVWRKATGIAIGSKYSMAPIVAAATLKLRKDGSVTIYHSADEMGQGCNTVLAQIAAEEFGIPVEAVRIVFSDTLYTPPFPGSTSSRTTYALGNAVQRAAHDAKRRLCNMLAYRLNVTPEELEVRGGQIYVREKPEERISISKAFASHRDQQSNYVRIDEIEGSDTWIQDYTPENAETGQIDAIQAEQGRRLTAFYTHTAKGVEVAVNTETGEVKVLRCASASDMGKAVNPKMCEQQMEGGIVMGIGTGLYEEMQLVDGKVINPNFTDYRVPSTMQVPHPNNLTSMIVEAPHKDGPFGAKGLGESTLIGMEPAIGNAINKAVGLRIKGLPITREKVWRELKKRAKQQNRG